MQNYYDYAYDFCRCKSSDLSNPVSAIAGTLHKMYIKMVSQLAPTVY